jgi:hypothetical protein
MPRDAWESLHGGSRKWFPEQRPRSPQSGMKQRLPARTAEPVSGQLKTCQELTAMSRRGPAACESEWLLACTAHNLRKLHRHLLQG